VDQRGSGCDFDAETLRSGRHAEVFEDGRIDQNISSCRALAGGFRFAIEWLSIRASL
jgi:hypothetical protein